jgi:ABC-type transport system involved in multi-copper enzyme maturation permease subunit
MLVAIFFVYFTHTNDYDLFADPFKTSRLLSANELANMANALVGWCLIVQFVAVLLLTPAVVADAIAREKERRALDFLFVTDLTNREIIFGKLGSRLAYLFGVLLTGLPILGLARLWGGVGDVLLYGGYAALFATLLSLGALSMLCSVSSQTSLQATVRAYVGGTALLAVCGCLLIPIFEGDTALPGVLTYVAANVAFAVVSLFVCVRELRPWAEYLVTTPTPVSRPTAAPPPRRRLPAAEPVLQTATSADDNLPFVLPADEAALAKPRGVPLSEAHGWDPVEPWGPGGRLPIWEPPDLLRAPLPPVDDERPLLW